MIILKHLYLDLNNILNFFEFKMEISYLNDIIISYLSLDQFGDEAFLFIDNSSYRWMKDDYLKLQNLRRDGYDLTYDDKVGLVQYYTLQGSYFINQYMRETTLYEYKNIYLSLGDTIKLNSLLFKKSLFNRKYQISFLPQIFSLITLLVSQNFIISCNCILVAIE